MGAIEAMARVFAHLDDGDAVAAQRAVLGIEARGSVLPSSMFERVLRAAIEQDDLTPEYAHFCRAAYGAKVYVDLCAKFLPRDESAA